MWTYKGQELTDDMIPDKSIGFIYLMKHLPTGKKYIGRKLLTRAHTRQKNKKIIRSRVESDWKEYWSSSPEIIKMIEEEGTDNFVREILMFAAGKGILNYLEEKLQYSIGVLESEEYFNTNIRAKMFKRNIIGKISAEETEQALLTITNF